MGFLLKAVGFLALLVGVVHAQSSSVWTYSCQDDNNCHRVLRSDIPTGGVGVPLDVCKLNCHPTHGSLFPLPTGQLTLGQNLTGFYPGNVAFTGYDQYPIPVRDLFRLASGIFAGYLTTMKPGNETDPIYQDANLTVAISVSDLNLDVLTLDTDESYTLNVTSSGTDNKIVRAEVTAANFYGARHALETLSQLIAYDEDNDVLQLVNSALIMDKPTYRYRGVALDTSRNFISVDGIKRLIDGLSFNKMNIFHWHITDTHAFPMEVRGRPKFTEYGAYSARQVYSLTDMAEIVDYARPRGVKVLPEFDEPAHTGFGWEWGPSEGLGNLVVCLNEDPWYDFCVEPPCGQLNVVNEEVYNLLGEIFGSMLSIFDNDLFHMGGDEVHLGCYNSSTEITTWMAENDLSTDTAGFMALWGRFQDKAHAKLVNASRNANITSIVWTSEMTHADYISQYLSPQDYAIQIWTETLNEMTPQMISAGYRVIFSNYDTLYLDCGFHSWIGTGHNWCSPYKGWQGIYDHSPHAIYANATNVTEADAALADGRLLGSEAPLWMEQADGESFESRVWPRASALGERLWSNPTPEEGSWADAEVRMVTQRARFVSRGVGADRLQPEFCSQYQGKCYGYGAWPGAPDPTTPAGTTPDDPTPSPDPSTTAADPSTSSLPSSSLSSDTESPAGVSALGGSGSSSILILFLVAISSVMTFLRGSL